MSFDLPQANLVLTKFYRNVVSRGVKLAVFGSIMADDDFLLNTLGGGQQEGTPGGFSQGGYQGAHSIYAASTDGSRDGARSYGGTPNRGSSRTPGKPPRTSLLDSGRR